MRHLIVVAGLSLAILAGSVGEVAAATDDRYDCTAAHQEGLTVYAPGLTRGGTDIQGNLESGGI
jgi:hypothetical protein